MLKINFDYYLIQINFKLIYIPDSGQNGVQSIDFCFWLSKNVLSVFYTMKY